MPHISSWNQRPLFIWQRSYFFVMLLCRFGHAKMRKSSYCLLSRLLKWFRTGAKVAVFNCFCVVYPAKTCIFNASKQVLACLFSLLLRGLLIIGQRASIIVQDLKKFRNEDMYAWYFSGSALAGQTWQTSCPSRYPNFPLLQRPPPPQMCIFSEKIPRVRLGTQKSSCVCFSGTTFLAK